MFKFIDIYGSWNTGKVHKKRSIEDIQTCAAGKKKDSFSVKYAPLLAIDLDHVVPDELHLFLRIMDVLIENLITQVKFMDTTRHLSDPLLGATMQKLLSKIQLCGVPFQIWHKRDDNSTLDWTSLGGSAKRKLLSQLPLHFDEILPSDSSKHISKLWKVNLHKYVYMQNH